MANMIDPKIVELAQGYLPIFLFDPLDASSLARLRNG